MRIIQTLPLLAIKVWKFALPDIIIFLYVDECVEATIRLMHSDWAGPVNIGSDEMVSINQLARMVMDISGKKCQYKTYTGPS
jgi:GDP-D-mannose 3', 5'-epimerase